MKQTILLCMWLLPLAVGATPIGDIDHVTITSNNEHNPACHGFKPTAKQVHAFFKRAIVVSGRQNHDYFLYGPCVVEGTLKTRYDTWQWTLRSAGTGSLVASNGEVFLLADPKQESPLGE